MENLSRRAFLAVTGLGLASCSKVARRATSTDDQPGQESSTSTVSTNVASTSTASTNAASEVATAAQYISHGSTDGGKVALTFHTNGDLKLVNLLLDALKKREIVMTSFLVGNWAKQNAPLVKRIRDEGHDIANHTWSHLSMLKLSRSEVATEIVKGNDAIESACGVHPIWFRPSSTEVPNEIILEEAAKAGFKSCIGYNVDPKDYKDPGPATVQNNFAATVGAGSIVSLHFGHNDTILSLPHMLDLLDSKNLKPVALSELLKL